ncbi:hypothetical protein ASG92_08765 [Arthrobacter sp. Soil736]|nr:hypothetical protein ASG92_08765 [Arthrobacter sp. Soil736]
MARHRMATANALMALIGSPAGLTRPARPKVTGRPDHPERGDVPGWVMITLMSAVLVAALLALAGPALEAMFNQAMDTVGK